MINSKAVLAKLFELRKDYQDDEEHPTYLALHQACLFISYKIADFEAYLRDVDRLDAASRDD